MTPNKVFLGGTTAGPSWRDVLIPSLKCPYFNPIVKDWTEEAREKEKAEKDDCGISLYVLTPFLKTVFSVAEILEDCITRRPERTVVCLLDGFQGKTFEPHVKRSIDAVMEMIQKYQPTVVKDLGSCANAINVMSTQPLTEVYLLKNPWLSLKKLYGPTGEYVFSHEERCGGHIVSVLPYRNTDQGVFFLARSEFTPPWSLNRPFISSITGGVDSGESVAHAAARELFEEAGLSVPEEFLIPLGTVQGTKSTDTVYHLFAADVTGMPGPGNTDGQDSNESSSQNVWVDGTLPNVEDPLLYSLYQRWLNTPRRGGDFFSKFSW